MAETGSASCDAQGWVGEPPDDGDDVWHHERDITEDSDFDDCDGDE